MTKSSSLTLGTTYGDFIDAALKHVVLSPNSLDIFDGYLENFGVYLAQLGDLTLLLPGCPGLAFFDELDVLFPYGGR